MKEYNGYLIDLDGTMYRGNKVIEEAPSFIKKLRQERKSLLFLTNNSSKTPEQVAKKLTMLGIEAKPEEVFTSSMATGKYVKKKLPHGTCFVIGEEGLFDALHREGVQITDNVECDAVIMGIDHQITYEKLAKASLAVQKGAALISTNSDNAFPSEQGLVPGNGAFTTVITVSTGVEAQFIGKPETIIVEEALRVLGTSKSETILVGDNYNTDIRAGINAGIDTLMVFTGVTPFEQYEELPIKPTYYVKNLNEWLS
ncbi:TIGR01457 family HAD-type hydrolase [Ornithinibacillus bavariensis]|uniref:TIGR01457 family HAD-type hydrolase n=1 Tax=Ornithinibacillus bavariensis TaxID=545502 RepID=UPI000EDFF176|nr:TIGR01457 family HAD-type hydrolase [Ornithinibacillus sp.]